MKLILNKTLIARDRFTLILDGKGMGGIGASPEHYSNNFVIANGVDKGHGYQEYWSVDYFLSENNPSCTDEMRAIIRKAIA